jgi:hypothetical protein
MKNFIVAFSVVLLIMLAALIELSMWKECLRDHSWFYCVRVLSASAGVGGEG